MKKDSTQKRRSNKRSRLRAKLIWSTVATAVAVTAGVYWYSAGASQSQPVPRTPTTGNLEAPDSFHNFGPISMGKGKVTHTYQLVNQGDEPALIRRLYTSCMCTEATLVDAGGQFGPFGMEGHTFIPEINRIVPPGETVTVRAVFDPNAHGPAGIGRNDRAIAVLIGNGTKLDLKFTAYVTP